MKHDAVNCSLSPKELWYILFKKKRCPFCGNKMKKEKTFQTRKGSEVNGGNDPFFRTSSNVKDYEIQYVCVECKRTYKLNQLVK